ncbi:Transcriptional regulatory protein YpdB [compost metagenome]
MLKIGICEDERNVLNQISAYIQETLHDEIEYSIREYSDGQAMLRDREVFDLVFLDCDMPGINGYALAQEIRELDTDVKIVFITSYSIYKDYAFSVHAFGYLVKPIDLNILASILWDAVKYIPPGKKDIHQVKFLFKEGVRSFQLKDILYFEYMNRDIHLQTLKGKEYIIHKEKISNISRKMSPYDFVVPHKSFVINLHYVHYVKGYNIYMTGGEVIPLSQSNSPVFRKKLDIFHRKLVAE